VFCCIDGIDGTGKTTVTEMLAARYGLPVVRGSYRYWDNKPWPKALKEITDEFLVSTVQQLADYVHRPILFDRSTVSSAAYQNWNMSVVDWHAMYPPEKTVFILLMGDANTTIANEGLPVTDELMGLRMVEQMKFIKCAKWLGDHGYDVLLQPMIEGSPVQVSECVHKFIVKKQAQIEGLL
jgi:hypothetical protein